MAHRSRLAGFIIDCHTTPADKAAAFWSAALGYRAQPAYSEDGAEYADLLGAPAGLNVDVQRVEHASRVHLDIESDDIKRWWVMEAPVGHRFCIVRMRDKQKGRRA